jgi:hypothetical protein
MFLYRYSGEVSPEGETLPYTTVELELLQHSVMLRYPLTVQHELGEGSPIQHWTTAEGVLQVGGEG